MSGDGAGLSKRPGESQTAFAIRCIQAEAWDEGANAAVRPHNAGTHMTLHAVIPFPDNPYRDSERTS